jgi:hypothetical protein
MASATFNDRKGPSRKQGKVQETDLPLHSNAQHLDAALDMEQGTTQTLVRALQTLDDTKTQGSATLAELARNKETHAAVAKHLDTVDSELTTSRKLITRVAKRLSTDRILWAFCLLLILAVVGVVVYWAACIRTSCS